MTKYTILILNAAGKVIGSEWTYNKEEVKSIVGYYKKHTFAKGVSVNGKVWMF